MGILFEQIHLTAGILSLEPAKKEVVKIFGKSGDFQNDWYFEKKT
jgi:hypothetical protein